jgi:signal transduction histidine kinase
MQLSFFKNLTLGFRFDKEREIVSLIFLCYFYILLFSAVLILIYTSGEELYPVTYRYHTIILLGIAELVLIRFRLINLAKILILTLTPFLLLILPLLAGLTSDEFYFWFPYVPIALSLIPHFILHTHRERFALWVTLLVYFLLALLITPMMLQLKDGGEQIIPIVLENRFYYSFVPMVIYLFVNLALGLVFARNYRYEQIVIEQQDELIRTEKMASLGTLTTGIAHEINNPLNFISGGLHALKTLLNQYSAPGRIRSGEKEELAGKMNKIMDNSLEGVLRASEIITSLRFFANPGRMVKSENELETMLYSVMLTIERKIPYHVSFSKEIPAGIKIYCYEEQIQQVISNILHNALEAIEESKETEHRMIHISASLIRRDKQEMTSISIRNNGPAIPEAEFKNIYDPFFTLNDNSSRKGLGMAISYMIINEHKGWIEARNEGDWVVFDVILPVH